MEAPESLKFSKSFEGDPNDSKKKKELYFKF